MDGQGYTNNSRETDIYTGSKILTDRNILNGNYYFVLDSFSSSKKPQKIIDLNNCIKKYENNTIKIYYCN
jgi:hypothetical protein